jgi:hypothetical protein
MKVLTYFDDDLWSKYGKTWKKPSVKVIDPIVFCSKDASPETRLEIESAFSSFRVCDVRFFQLCDFFMSEVLEGEKDYSLVSPDKSPPFDVLTNKDAFCTIKDSTDDVIFEISKCAFNLLDRVEVIEKLNSIRLEKGGILDPSLIWGTSDFWIGFTGFQRYLKNSGYVTNNVDRYYSSLALNLFYCTSESFSLEAV